MFKPTRLMITGLIYLIPDEVSGSTLVSGKVLGDVLRSSIAPGGLGALGSADLGIAGAKVVATGNGQ